MLLNHVTCVLLRHPGNEDREKTVTCAASLKTKIKSACKHTMARYEMEDERLLKTHNSFGSIKQIFFH